MPLLEEGSRGREVRDLQLELRALGFYKDDVDGIFGPITKKALSAFQDEYESLTVSGVLDNETAAALAQALAMRETPGTSPPLDTAKPPVACAAATWNAFQDLVKVVTNTPVRYGPGRGLFSDGKWVITRGPGSLDSTNWKSVTGKTYPSFHCSSWTNFFLGWLLRYNEDYTHAGNIPSLFDLCEKSDDLHRNPGAGSYRGYGPHCRLVATNGTTLQRHRIRNVVDIKEIYERRDTLPTFLVCGQSTKKDNVWKWWHHTLLFVVDHSKPDHPLFRLAADGFKNSQGAYSATQMKWVSIDPAWLEADAPRHVYRAYGVVSEDGTYGGNRPMCAVEAED